MIVKLLIERSFVEEEEHYISDTFKDKINTLIEQGRYSEVDSLCYQYGSFRNTEVLDDNMMKIKQVFVEEN